MSAAPLSAPCRLTQETVLALASLGVPLVGGRCQNPYDDEAGVEHKCGKTVGAHPKEIAPTAPAASTLNELPEARTAPRASVGPSAVFCKFWNTIRLENGVVKNGNMWSLLGGVSWINGTDDMLIRDCYVRDADELLGGGGIVSVLKAALILGPKGIGKTMFLNYLIVRIVEKLRSESRLDALSICYVHKPIDTTECVRFTPQGCTFDPSGADYFLSDSVDIADKTLGSSLLLEVASENQNNYKKFSDRLLEMPSKRFIMDVWTLEELRRVKLPTLTDGELEFLYSVFGGRVRYIFDKSLDSSSVDAVIENMALWFFGDDVKRAYPASWNRALQLIHRIIAGARGKTTNDELAIQTSLFLVINSDSGSGFSSTFLKLLAGQMREKIISTLWSELDKLLGGAGKGLMFEALGHMKLTQTDKKYTAKPLNRAVKRGITLAFNLPKMLIRSVDDIEMLVEGHYGIPIFGNFMLVDAIVKPNIMLQFTVSLQRGNTSDVGKWGKIRAKLGGVRKNDKLIFVIPPGNFGRFSCVGVPTDLNCYYMTFEDVANDNVLTGAKRTRC